MADIRTDHDLLICKLLELTAIATITYRSTIYSLFLGKLTLTSSAQRYRKHYSVTLILQAAFTVRVDDGR
jgi:hypothetical protein